MNKIGEKTVYSRLLSTIFFRPVFWSEACPYFNQSKTTSFVYFTQTETVTSLKFCAAFSKLDLLQVEL